MTPAPDRLFLAVSDGDARRLAALLKEGVDPNVTGDPSREPLILAAARKEDASLLHTVVEAGADVNRCSPSGETALMAATRFGHAANIGYLLEKGANAAAQDRAGQTAASLAGALLVRNYMNLWNGVHDAPLTPEEKRLVDKWDRITAVLKQAEKEANSIALNRALPVKKPLRLKPKA